MNLYELNKQLKIARQNGFIFIQINKLTIKFYSNLSIINIHYYLKFPIPILHRQFFKILSQSPDYVQTHCYDRNNPFHFAIRKWMINQKFSNQSSFSKTLSLNSIFQNVFNDIKYVIIIKNFFINIYHV